MLERTREAGKKVLMSGGTRCNVLPLEADLPVSDSSLGLYTAASRVVNYGLPGLLGKSYAWPLDVQTRVCREHA